MWIRQAHGAKSIRTHLARLAARTLIAVLREKPLVGALGLSIPVRLSRQEQRDLAVIRRYPPFRAALAVLTVLLRTRRQVKATEAARVLAEALPGVPVRVTERGRGIYRVRPARPR